MATINSAASGNFTSGATWVGGVVPTTGDTAVVLAGHVVTINSSVTCDAVTNANNSGYFDLVDGGVLNANVTGGATDANNGVVRAAGATGSATINGNIQLTQATSSTFGVLHYGAMSLTINGNILQQTNSNTSCITVSCNNGGGNLTINGNITGGRANYSNGVRVEAHGNATRTINGNIFGGTGSDTGGLNIASGTATVNGNISTAGNGFGCYGGSSATLILNGNASTTSTAPAIGGSGGVSFLGTAIIEGDITDSSTGYLAVRSSRLFLKSPADNTWQHRRLDSISPIDGTITSSAIDFNSTTAGADYPDEEDVREGTVFGLGDFTGTLAVPPRSLVSYGVPTDNTTGTAALNLTDITNAIDAATLSTASNIQDATDIITNAIETSENNVEDAILESTETSNQYMNMYKGYIVSQTGAQIAAAISISPPEAP